MTAALQYLSINSPQGCTELWNQARLAAYLDAGITPDGFLIEPSVGDGLVDLLADPDVPEYSTPQADGAPWFDDHREVAARAGRFAGLLPLQITGLDDDTTTVDVIGTADGGTTFANRRDMPREIGVTALLIGQDCCSVRHGLQWLKDVLADTACGPFELQWLGCLPGELAQTASTELLLGRYQDGSPMQYEDGSPIYFGAGPDPTPVPMLYDDGTPMRYDGGTPMYYVGVPQGGPYLDVPTDEWWRVLTGVAHTNPVKVVERYGTSCGCGGAPVLQVEFGFTAAAPTVWRPARAVAVDRTFADAPVRPTYRFRKRPRTVRTVQQQRARREYPVVLRGDRWCPVGDWVWSDVQQGGGEGYIVVQEALESVAKDWAPNSPCATRDCKPRYIRLVLDEVNSQTYFETIRWTNYAWDTPDPLAAVPCDCPVEILELVRITLDNEGNPQTTTSAPGSGEDCCYVALSWTATTIGNWSAIAAPDTLDLAPRTEWGSDLAARPFKSGWPPAGCRLVVHRNCPAELPPTDDCPESVDCSVTLRPDGTWVSSSFDYDRATFPPVRCRWVINGQTTEPITEWVNETVYGECQASCYEPDPLADPQLLLPRAPQPPVLSASSCMPATSRELRLAWSDFRGWDTVVPIIEFYSGEREVRGVEVLVWANPLGIDPTQETAWSQFADCNACGSWQLSRVPAGTRIVIDARTRTVTARLQGGRTVNASRLLVSRPGLTVEWPQIVSCGLVAAVKVARTAIDVATATASLYVAGVGS